LVVRQLTAAGLACCATTEPSLTPLGDLIRAGTSTYRGMTLACLVAGDRHHHLAAEIRPRKSAGQIVICDRYLPSSLVLQRIDGVSWDVIWQLNAGADVPDLAVILNAGPAVLARRIAERGGTHNRFETIPHGPQAEHDLYHDTAARLGALGWPACLIDSTSRTPAEVAAIVTDRILTLLADRRADD
jgi:dTMP kinase